MSDLFGGGATTTTGNSTSTQTGSGTQTGTTYNTGNSSTTGTNYNNTTGTNSYDLPDWLTSASAGIAGQVAGLFGRPYQGYTSPFAAPMSSNERSGYAMAGETPWSRDVTSARSAYDNAGRSFTSANIKGYMNPYTEQALDPVLRNMRKEYIGQNNLLRDRSAATGGFGGSRGALLESEAARNQNEQLGDFQAQGYDRAFNAATNLWNQDQNRQLSIGQGYTGLADLGMRGQGQRFGQLMSSGGVARGIDQMDLNAKYGEFLRGQNWDSDRLGKAAGILSQLPHGYTGTSAGSSTGGSSADTASENQGTSTGTNTWDGTQAGNQQGQVTPPSPSQLGQLLGAFGTVAGIAQALGINASTVAGWFKGGSGGAAPSGTGDQAFNPMGDPAWNQYTDTSPFEGYTPWSDQTQDWNNTGFDPNYYPSNTGVDDGGQAVPWDINQDYQLPQAPDYGPEQIPDY